MRTRDPIVTIDDEGLDDYDPLPPLVSSPPFFFLKNAGDSSRPSFFLKNTIDL
jgi:hypothetical protein